MRFILEILRYLLNDNENVWITNCYMVILSIYSMVTSVLENWIYEYIFYSHLK